jgi:hypothetical protein
MAALVAVVMRPMRECRGSPRNALRPVLDMLELRVILVAFRN